MKIRVRGLRLPLEHDENQLIKEAARRIGVKEKTFWL